MTKAIGDNTPYSDEIRQEILDRLCMGESLLSITKDERMPNYQTVMEWCEDFKTGEITPWGEKYTRARETQAELLGDEAKDLTRQVVHTSMSGEKNHVEIQALQMLNSSLKWQAERLAPRKYTTRLRAEIDAKHSGSINIDMGCKDTIAAITACAADNDDD